MRMSGTVEAQTGSKANGFDYVNQAWVKDGRYIACGHPESMHCNCYGTVNAGKPLASNAEVH
jgi:hypothetical protein